MLKVHYDTGRKDLRGRFGGILGEQCRSQKFCGGDSVPQLEQHPAAHTRGAHHPGYIHAIIPTADPDYI
jgi:hypothetical protein